MPLPSAMNASTTPLTYGVRQAIRDSPKSTYEIGRQCKVTPQNLYRFLDGDPPRSLSQKSLDSLGSFLRLKLTLGHASLAPGHGKDYRIVFNDSKRVVPIDKLISGPGDDPLSVQMGRAVKLHRKGFKEIAGGIGVTLTQMYRFLDGSRGLSQQRLDALCAFLGLYVEGPPEFVPPRVRGAMPTTRGRIYIPKPLAQESVQSESEGRRSSQPRPPSLYVPPDDADVHS